MNQHDVLKLQTTIINFDKRQSKGKRYNRFALPQYLSALQQAGIDVETGASIGSALAANFQGALLSALGKSMGIVYVTDRHGNILDYYTRETLP